MTAAIAELPKRLDWRRCAGIFGMLATLVLLIVLSQHAIQNVRVDEVKAAFRDLGTLRTLMAVLFTAASYVLLTFYDRLALQMLGVRVPVGVTMRAAFTSYAISHTLGFGAITGGSARLRIYGKAGLPTRTIARIVAIAGVAFWIGVTFATTLALLAIPRPIHLPTFDLEPGVAHAAGLAVLALLAALIFGVRRALPEKLRARIELIAWPSMATMALLALVSVADLTFASLALYVLLPHAGLSFAGFVLAYALAIALGLVLHVPGGLGVFEAVIVATIGSHASTASILGALVAYRAVYYLLPLCIALSLNAAIESGRSVSWASALLMRATAPARRLALALSPMFFAGMSFAGGIVLLLSGAVPAEHDRLHHLVHLVPLPFIETSHLAASLVGTGLLLVAPALAQRLASGLRAARLLFLLGAMFSLAKGLDFEEAMVMLAMVALLQLAAPAFYRGRKAAFSTHNLPWLLAAGAAVIAATAIGAMFHDADRFRSDLWWHFALYGDGPRALRASFATSVLIFAFAMREWMSRPRAIGGQTRLPQAVIDRATSVCPRSDAALAHTGDKRFLVSTDGECFIMFRPRGRTWVVMGDPVGTRDHWHQLVWDLRRLADASNALLCFYQASAELLPVLVELGLSVMKYGEEAIVDPRSFSLVGPRMKSLRNSCARARRDGLTLRIISPDEVQDWLDRLRPISEIWLDEHKTQEKGFSLGRFDLSYLRHFAIAVVLRDEQPVAFANIWRSGDGGEMSVDLMRQLPDAPPGTMDFLLTSLIEHARSSGAARFNLGLAPLSGLPGGRLAPFWARLARVVHDVGGRVYNFAGLRFYKQKYAPAWESRYLACPQGPQGFFAVGAVIALVSGGNRG